MLKILYISAILAIASACISACNKDAEQAAIAPEVLIQVGDSVLTRDMVTSLIPAGLSASDSIRMFDAIVEAWVDRNMLVSLAGSQLPDIEKIDRMVEQYREQLLANEYRKMMATNHTSNITSEQVKEYYDTHAHSLMLTAPLLKGIYLKTNAASEQKDELRAWLKSATSDDIDNIENYGLSDAMEYDYFGDTWISWLSIDDRIPYRFGDPDTFVSENEYFEWENNGSLYMLRILDHISSGRQMPLEYAETNIREILIDEHRGEYDRALLQSLYDNALKQQAIKPGTYTPLKYR